MKLIWAILKNILRTVVVWGIVAALVFFAWNFFKKKRESRTFTVSFNQIEGLAKGAPIFSQGVKIGKVIDIFPLGNTNELVVKGLITDKNYSVPRGAIGANIVSDIEGGGGKFLEIQLRRGRADIESEHILLGATRPFENKSKGSIHRGKNPFTAKHAMRLMRDFFQMTVDSAEKMLAGLNSDDTQRYRDEISNAVNNTVTSLEYGTVKSDLTNKIHDLNRDIKKYEAGVDREADMKEIVNNQARALSNTIKSFGTLQDIYKR
jgi:hypothetical protein